MPSPLSTSSSREVKAEEQSGDLNLAEIVDASSMQLLTEAIAFRAQQRLRPERNKKRPIKPKGAAASWRHLEAARKTPPSEKVTAVASPAPPPRCFRVSRLGLPGDCQDGEAKSNVMYLQVPQESIEDFRAMAKDIKAEACRDAATHNPFAQALCKHRAELQSSFAAVTDQTLEQQLGTTHDSLSVLAPILEARHKKRISGPFCCTTPRHMPFLELTEFAHPDMEDQQLMMTPTSVLTPRPNSARSMLSTTASRMSTREDNSFDRVSTRDDNSSSSRG